MKILVLTRYGRLGASSRLRVMQYESLLAEEGVEFKFQSFFNDQALAELYNGGYKKTTVIKSYVKRFCALLNKSKYDLVWIEKEALPWLPYFIERLLLSNSKFVLDYDDAVFHNYDLHNNKAIRWLLGDKLDRLMKASNLVMCGNEYLAQRAEDAGANNVQLIPTSIDIDRYQVKSNHNASVPTIVWIGSPSTVSYLKQIEEPLARLQAEIPFRFKIIGGKAHFKTLKANFVDWSEDSEVSEIAKSDIGIMPLEDQPWERGKCGYKLIQYMGCGLPVVGSPVGVNSTIIQEGKNGYLASTSDEWYQRLKQLLQDREKRESFGAAGRHNAENRYSIQINYKKIIKAITSLT